MCLAIPYKVLEIEDGTWAGIKVAGARQRVNVHLFPEVKAGDWVLVNLGSVISRIEEDEAKEIIRLYQEVAEIRMPQTAVLRLIIDNVNEEG